MRTRYKIIEQGAPQFMTATVVEWMPVFTSSAYCDIVIQSLQFCREHKGLILYGFVVMDSHIHILAGGTDMPRIMKEFKSFTATQIINVSRIAATSAF